MLDPIPPLASGRNPPPDAPLAIGGLPQLPELEPVKPPQEIPERAREARRVANRLLAIIADHQAAATRLGVPLDRTAIATVVRALVAESHRQDPGPILIQPDEIRTYVLTTLYEELLEEPSNILHTTTVDQQTLRYEAMEVAFWRESLGALLDLVPE
jgi:hypothetical protein